MEINERIRMAAESILENEALLAGLDEGGTSAVIDWGISCARQIVLETDGEDDDEIEEAMYPRMRALRKLIEAAKQFARAEDLASRISLLDTLAQPAATVYGEKFTPPDASAMGVLVAGVGLSHQENIINIRNLFENNTQGETNV